jgi:hypothetical protein
MIQIFRLIEVGGNQIDLDRRSKERNPEIPDEFASAVSTNEALEKALSSIEEKTAGKIISVVCQRYGTWQVFVRI